jgi:transposase
MDLTDEQWAVLEPVLTPTRRPDGRGRPFQDPRAVLNGVLWILRTGAPWKDLPARYPPYQTCHRRFQHWRESGRLDTILQVLAEDLRDRGRLDLTEGFIDATFTGAKKGAPKSGPPNVGKAARSWQSATAMVFLSPSTWRALRRLKSGSSSRRSRRGSSPTSRRD